MCIVYITSLPGSSVLRLFAENAAGLTAGRWEGLMLLDVCAWLVVEGEAAPGSRKVGGADATRCICLVVEGEAAPGSRKVGGACITFHLAIG